MRASAEQKEQQERKSGFHFVNRVDKFLKKGGVCGVLNGINAEDFAWVRVVERKLQLFRNPTARHTRQLARHGVFRILGRCKPSLQNALCPRLVWIKEQYYYGYGGGNVWVVCQ